MVQVPAIQTQIDQLNTVINEQALTLEQYREHVMTVADRCNTLEDKVENLKLNSPSTLPFSAAIVLGSSVTMTLYAVSKQALSTVICGVLSSRTVVHLVPAVLFVLAPESYALPVALRNSLVLSSVATQVNISSFLLVICSLVLVTIDECSTK